MIRFLLNVVRIIISIYLCAIILFFAYMMVYKELYKDNFPLINGYSYIKMDDDNLSPKYVKNDYVFVKYEEEQKISEGDYVIYLKNDTYPLLKQVTKVDDYIVTLNFTKKDEEVTMNFDKIVAKAIYHNSTLSKILHIITNPITLVVLFIGVVIMPELTYRRY